VEPVASAEIRWQQRSVGGREMPLWEYSFGELSCEEYYQHCQDNQSPQKAGIAA
jgi:hypothetical protein